MTNKTYTMDFAFYNSLGVYNFDAQCEMVKDIGYDGIQRSIWDGTRWEMCKDLASIKEKYDLDVAGVYIVLNLDFPLDHAHNTGILTMLENIQGCKMVDLAIQSAGSGLQPSSPQGDEIIIEWLKEALTICTRRDIQLLLYPHLTFWLDKHSDAIRLCQKIDHPNLGIVMTAVHWYLGGERNLREFLNQVYPYLKKVHLSGSVKTPLGWGGLGTAQPLDTGELDSFSIIGALKNMGYTGMFGFLNWDNGGDPYSKLKRSHDALRSMITRADEHPNWTHHI